MKCQEEREVSRMKDLTSQLSEHFGDYVVIARVKDGLIWSFSDRTFAIGAASRFHGHLTMDDQATYNPDHDLG